MSPVPGSPFALAEPPRKLLAAGSNLLVQGESSISVFDADRETGALKQTQFVPAPLLRDAVVNTADSTVYVLDQNAVSGFRLENGQMIALPGSPFPLAESESGQRVPIALAMADSARAVYIALGSISGGAPESFEVLNRAPDGSLSGLSAVREIPEEVRRAISGSSAKPRIAAVIYLQAAQ